MGSGGRMREWHPDELELARASELEAGGDLADHLRWCSRCRAVAADYEWLDEEIAGAFDAGLEEADVPRAGWESVDERLRPRQRSAVGGQFAALVGAVVVTCMMLVAPSVLVREAHGGGRVAGEMATVRLPVSAVVDDHTSGTGAGPALTMTPALSSSSRRGAVSLPFVPPPEPPEPEA